MIERNCSRVVVVCCGLTPRTVYARRELIKMYFMKFFLLCFKQVSTDFYQKRGLLLAVQELTVMFSQGGFLFEL